MEKGFDAIVIHDAIKPAYYTPFQGYVLAIFFVGFGAFAVLSPIFQCCFKR